MAKESAFNMHRKRPMIFSVDMNNNITPCYTWHDLQEEKELEEKEALDQQEMIDNLR